MEHVGRMKNTLWTWLVGALCIGVVGYFVVPNLPAYYVTIIIYAGINVILAMSLNLVIGFTGQFSMGHAGFMAVGGYTAAMITLYVSSHWPELLMGTAGTAIFAGALLAGGLLAAVFGWCVGLPSLRLRGDYLAIVTLGFGEIIRVILLNISAVGGARGLPSIPPLSNFYWVYFLALITGFVVWRIIESARGRAFISVREDEIAAEAMGVNTTSVKVQAFIIGAFMAGVAGGLFAHYLQYLNPATFDFNRSFEIIIMVVLGGLGSISGSVIAAIFLTAVKEMLRPLQQYTGVDLRMVIYALLLLVLMLTRPNGLMGKREVSSFFPKRRKAVHE